MSTKRQNPNFKKRIPSKPLPTAPNRRLPPSIPPSPTTKYVITPKRPKPPRPPRSPKPPRMKSKSTSCESDSEPSSSYSHCYKIDKMRKPNSIPLSRVDDYDHMHMEATVSVEDNDEIDDSITIKTPTDDELPPKAYHKGSAIVHDSMDKTEEYEAAALSDRRHKSSVVFHDSEDEDEDEEYSISEELSIDIKQKFREQIMKHNMSPKKSQQNLNNMKRRISNKRHIVTHSLFTTSTPPPRSTYSAQFNFKKHPQKRTGNGTIVHHQRITSVPPGKPLPTPHKQSKEDIDIHNTKANGMMPITGMLSGGIDIAVAKPMRTRNVLRQSHSPITPQRDEHVQFEYNPNKHTRNTRNTQSTQSLQKISRSNGLNGSHTKPKPAPKPKKPRTSSFNGLNEFHPSNRGKSGNRSAIDKIKSKMNMKIKAKKSVQLDSKHIHKSVTPTPQMLKLNRADSQPIQKQMPYKIDTNAYTQSSSQYNIIAEATPTAPATDPIQKTKVPQLLLIDSIRLNADEAHGSTSSSCRDTDSDSSSTTSSSDSDGTTPDSHHVKTPSHFVIKTMRHANSPRFGGKKSITPRARVERNNHIKRGKRKTITGKSPDLNIIKANKADKESGFGFDTTDTTQHRKHVNNGRYGHGHAHAHTHTHNHHRRAPQSARFAVSPRASPRDGDFNKKRRSKGFPTTSTLTYADYKRMRKKEEEKKETVETGSSIEWICGDQIGKGAFGTVYKGYEKKTGKLIAIKEFKYTFKNKEKTLKEFEKETKIMKQLKHNNIVEFFHYKIVESEQLIYLIMEYVPGNSIESIYVKRGHFSEITIQKYVFQIINGLHYAHSRNIIHRDIKGKNILVDNIGCVKIADFGSAILTEKDNNTKNNAWSMNFESTPLWTAPEVLTDGRYDLMIDIWSTGCCIIEMATAERPWSECGFKSPFQALFHIGNTDHIPLWPKSLSIQCQAFIAKCLIRDPDKRYSTKQLLQHPFLKTKSSY